MTLPTASHIVACAMMYGVDLPWLVAFLVTSILSWVANPLVYVLHQRKLRTESAEIYTHFDMDFAPTIGKLERVLYIYAVMYGTAGSAFAIISGWLVMKAFSVWLERTDASAKKMRYYHLYLYGNGLSVLAGLGLGALGTSLNKAITYMLS